MARQDRHAYGNPPIVETTNSGDTFGGQRWWARSVSKGDAFNIVKAHISSLEKTRTSRAAQLDVWYSLYTDIPNDDEEGEVADVPRDRRARFNVVQNGCDSVHSRITKNRPRPWVVTSGGSAGLQASAKALNKYMEGEFSRMKIYPLAATCGMDGEIFGTGALKIYAEHGRPKAERVDVAELLVDPQEARMQNVRTLYQVKFIDRGVLKQMFPKEKELIAGAPPVADEGDSEKSEISDLILCVEGWHLPSGPDAKDGRHVICIDNGTLFCEDWTSETFPFAFFKWAQDPRDFWGIGLAERMSGTQAELNTLSAKITDAFDLSAASGWVESGAMIKTFQVDNSPGRFYTYTGTPPIFMTPNPVSPMMLQREGDLIERSYSLQGISLLSASSQKPPGLNSGKALRNHHDIEAERFATAGRNWEIFHTDIASLILECTKMLAEDEEKARAKAKDANKPAPESKLVVHVGKSMLEAIAFVDGDLKDAPYDVRVFPVSALSTTPQGRLQDVQDMIEVGVITDPNEIRELLDYPDLEAYNDVESAARNIVDKKIELCLSGKPTAAHPYLDLAYAHRMAILRWDLSELEEEDNAKGREHLGNFIGMVESLMQAKEAKEAAAMAPPPMPMAPPVGPPMGGAPMPGPMPPMGPQAVPPLPTG